MYATQFIIFLIKKTKLNFMNFEIIVCALCNELTAHLFILISYDGKTILWVQQQLPFFLFFNTRFQLIFFLL